MRFLIILTILLLHFPSKATIRVAVNESRPYVAYHRDNAGNVISCSGLSIDVVHYLFNEDVKYIYCDSKQSVIDSIREGKADVGANVTLTADRMDVDYSIPYVSTYTGVLAKRVSQPTFLQSFIMGINNHNFLMSLLQVIVVIIALFIITGITIYFLEYKSRGLGFFDSCYISFVSIAFLAGLEEEPINKTSRIILTTITLVYSLTFAPYIIGYITAQIQDQNSTMSNYVSKEQLRFSNVFTAAGTSNERALQDNDINYTTAPIDEVIYELRTGKGVYVQDKNIIENYIFEHKLSGDLALTPIKIKPSERVFIYSKSFAHNKVKFDKVIVKMKDINKIQQMAKRYGINE